ncbi:MAG: FAD binding domain-containing protein [Pseudomonadota bacterium]
MQDYCRPDTLDAALAFAAGGARVLAGGTDLYPAAGARLTGPVLDLTGVAGLRGMQAGQGLRIGACTTWTDIAEASLPPALRALQQAAGAVGGRQIQNAGTIGGNLCNASPAADGVPPLLVCDAVVDLAGAKGTRRMALSDFLIGPRQTALQDGEVLVAVHLPQAGLAGGSAFLKLGARAYLVISIAMVAARVVLDRGIATHVAVAVGACSGVAQRLPLVERALTGAAVDQLAGLVRADDVMAQLSPIEDVRATAAYRATAATELVARAVACAAGAA